MISKFKFYLVSVLKQLSWLFLRNVVKETAKTVVILWLGVVTPIDLLIVKFTFYKRSNNLIVHLFAFRKTNGFSY
ncbi:hypothetical protein PDPUS_1_02088 [Photobacterium damselae subsp. piscicida]|uniref:Uncharacterized protein n=1 Tax=Photobacterium damsela subsp. piscicida TaxID=38294 RepID=A0A1V1V3U6_PHODP|nr:hypothetical protein [Photobacterium damselae]MBE8128920.1 hypothetical protein [Photobacterium damselae subsp. piscicida]MDP2532468.1 hypothetical protein [Photobacterium damselae subsp. piscicida]MDP2557997.1 hypothetical protein [Photobacterium damselae subsp. piscicida]QOD53605.1 hypothetical protein IC628_05705 [Photobacterium damselae subsp. piscicida]QOD57442.1 hypothetical protein IC627_05725 [Photobacterium damselae subsp. piscicida]